MTFRALCGDSPDTLTTVARFLALLELFREGAVAFDQVTPLGELTRPLDRRRATTRSRSPTSSTGAPEPSRRRRPAPSPTDEPTTREPTPTSTADERDRRQATSEDALEVPLAELRPALEAVLMVADQPLDESRWPPPSGYPVGEVADALAALAAEYAEQGRGFELRNVAGGWRYYTREELRRRSSRGSCSTASRPG